MSYLLDKKNKRRKISRILIILILLGTLFFLRNGIFKSLSSFTHWIVRPVIVLGNNVGNKFSNINIVFSSKKNLLKENQNLQLKLNENEFKMANYNSLLDENLKLKEVLERKINSTMVLGGILTKPNVSLYDTLIIDIGSEEGIVEGQRVFALGNIAIGRVVEVNKNSSKVVLFTNSGEKTQVFISGLDIYIEAMGRGGGNFEIILPKDLILEKGQEIVLPGITPYLLAKVDSIISDPHDSLQKTLLVSPVNIQQLKFVQVEK